MLPDGRIFLPQPLGYTLIKDFHDTTHLGSTKLTELLRKWFFIHNFEILAEISLEGAMYANRLTKKDHP
jgi:hypothetical protein